MKKLCVLLFLLVSFAAWAQDTIVLQSVEVNAEAIRQNQAEAAMERKMDTALLKRLNTITMSQLLIQHSPVFIKTYGPGGVATASFRGTTASQTLVLWNGFQLNAPTLGQVDFSTIPVFMTEQVALKWGSGTSANSGGLGGIVNIETNQHFGEGWILDLKQTYGSFNTFGSYITAGYSWASHLVRVKAYRTSSDNDFKYVNHADISHQVMKQKNGEYVDYGLMPEYQWRFRNSLITIVSWNQWSDRNCPQIMPNVGNADRTKEYTENGYSRNFISYKTYWESGKIEVKSAYFYEKQHYFLRTYTNIGTQVTKVESLNDAHVLHQIVDLNQNLYKSWKINAKAQWDYEQVESNNYDNTDNQGADRHVLSLYAALTGKLLNPIDLRLTLRNDWVDWKSAGVFPTATISYRCIYLKGLKINAGYSHNYRNPSLNDLYWNPGGNKDLKPENGRTVDGNLIYERKFGHFSLESTLGAYYSEVKDWIQWVPSPWRYWTPENVATVVAYGSEVHLKMNYFVNDWNFSVSGNYVYSHTTNKEDGFQLIYIPLHHANAYAEAKWKTWYLNYTMEYTGRRKTQLDTEEVLAGRLYPYTLHHVAMGKQIKKFTVEFRVNNITDVDYQAVLYRAMPGRSYEVSLNYKL
ncbi:MAG: TonB-dependent receptor [Bacteroidales bacterium]|nr:TonB-dependent receptor [Bacteroidales bacterium]